MLYLCLDTCSWIYLANETYPVSVLEELISRIEAREIGIILPEIVKREWDRNKVDTVKKDKIRAYESRLVTAKKLRPYLSEGGKANFDAVMKDLELNTATKESELSKSILAIDKLFANGALCTVVPISQFAKDRSIDLALGKRAPFKSKNSMGDSLLLFAMIELVKSRNIRNSIFISENKSDFWNDAKPEINSDIKPLLDDAYIMFEINIAKLLSQMTNTKITSEVVEVINRFHSDTLCPICKAPCVEAGYRHSQYGGGLSWHIRCPKCDRIFDTGDYWD